MSITAAYGATLPVQHLVLSLNTILGSTDTHTIQGPGEGTLRRREREKAKRKLIAEQDKARAKAAAKASKAKVHLDDVTIADFREEVGYGAVYVLNQRVGYWKQLGDKAVLFDATGTEVSSRSRPRDLKKAAVKLYEPASAKQESRQVRRRKQWPSRQARIAIAKAGGRA